MRAAAQSMHFRSAAFLRRMARLACVAVLLLAIAPAISRLRADAPSVAGWNAMCTSAGLAWVDAAASREGKRPPMEIPVGGDCSYCPLAASLALPPVPLLLARPALCEARPARRQEWAGEALRLKGAGCRGPPTTA